MINKKLYKSNNKKVCGVCGGIAEFFDIDPTIVRIIWAITAFTTGFGIFAYIVAAIILDENPESVHTERYSEDIYESSYDTDSDVIKGFKPDEN